MPSKTLECLFSNVLISCFKENVSLTALMCVPSSGNECNFYSVKDLSSLNCSIPNFVKVDLLFSGGELILPLTAKNLE